MEVLERARLPVFKKFLSVDTIATAMYLGFIYMDGKEFG